MANIKNRFKNPNRDNTSSKEDETTMTEHATPKQALDSAIEETTSHTTQQYGTGDTDRQYLARELDSGDVPSTEKAQEPGTEVAAEAEAEKLPNEVKEEGESAVLEETKELVEEQAAAEKVELWSEHCWSEEEHQLQKDGWITTDETGMKEPIGKAQYALLMAAVNTDAITDPRNPKVIPQDVYVKILLAAKPGRHLASTAFTEDQARRHYTWAVKQHKLVPVKTPKARGAAAGMSPAELTNAAEAKVTQTIMERMQSFRAKALAAKAAKMGTAAATATTTTPSPTKPRVELRHTA
jgi:hypothetical protein